MTVGEAVRVGTQRNTGGQDTLHRGGTGGEGVRTGEEGVGTGVQGGGIGEEGGGTGEEGNGTGGNVQTWTLR